MARSGGLQEQKLRARAWCLQGYQHRRDSHLDLGVKWHTSQEVKLLEGHTLPKEKDLGLDSCLGISSAVIGALVTGAGSDFCTSDGVSVMAT